MPDDIVKVLEERAKTHGSFRAHAGLCQSLKSACYAHPGYSALSPMQAEAVEMILHKIARAINGNANYKDHWDDIQGYAKLVSTELVTAARDAMENI